MKRCSPGSIGCAVLLSALSCSACNGVDAPPAASELRLAVAEYVSAPAGISSTPLFGCSYANFAWGHVFRGFVIDDAGRVWSFKHDKIWDGPKLAEEAGPLSVGGAWFERAPLLSMYSPAESSARLAADVVAKYRALIEPARLGKVSMRRVAVDAGGYGCEAYAWDESRTAYQEVVLGSMGDEAIINGSSAAHALNLWLHGVERALADQTSAQ